MVNHPNRKICAPNTFLANAARANGTLAKLMWEERGPKDTLIAWLSCYQLGKGLVIVQTYHEDNGWEAFTPCSSNRVDETIADVFNRCGVIPRAGL